MIFKLDWLHFVNFSIIQAFNTSALLLVLSLKFGGKLL